MTQEATGRYTRPPGPPDRLPVAPRAIVIVFEWYMLRGVQPVLFHKVMWWPH